MESFEKAETKLQKQLMQLCDCYGREIYPKQAAFIFNELGLLYKTKSPDKISLIQTAALLNAAIVRQPDNQKFQDDLDQLCKHVLECAFAKKTGANLIEIAQTAAAQITKMRNSVSVHLKKIQIPETTSMDQGHQKLKEIHYVDQVKLLQTNVAYNYELIMASISKQCIEVMGEPPCNYALVGMGSLARNEVSHYSDFEHVLTLNNFPNELNQQEIDSIKEYFRWYSVIFHISVINLRETDLYSVCIPCLNNHSKPGGNWFYDQFTPQGISFDGMMPHACHFPLGKTQATEKQPWTTELIKPVNEMVEFLKVKDIKKGYKLGDLLTKTCFVEGNESVYQQFSGKVKLFLEENEFEQHSTVKAQLAEDWDKFSLAYHLIPFSYNLNVNIKQIVYRSITLFVSALGRLNGLNQNSCFEIINELLKEKKISEFTAHKFLVAVAVACHIRLFQYNLKKRQDDDIYKEAEQPSKEKLKEMTNVVSQDNLVKCLLTVHLLQRMLKDNLNLNTFDFCWRENNSYFKMAFLNRLGLYHEAISEGESTTFDKDDWLKVYHFGHAYIKLGQFDKCLAMHEKLKPIVTMNDPAVVYNEMLCHSLTHFSNQHMDNKIDALLKSNLSKDVESSFLKLKSLNKLKLSQFRKSLNAARKWLKNYNTLSTKNVQIKIHYRQDLPAIMHYVIHALLGLHHDEQALHWALEGRNFLDLIQASIKLYGMFIDVISFYQHKPTALACDFNDRPTPVQTKCFTSTTGIPAIGLLDGSYLQRLNIQYKYLPFGKFYTTSSRKNAVGRRRPTTSTSI